LFLTRNEKVVGIRPFIVVNHAIIFLFCGCDMTAMLVHGEGALEYALKEALKFSTHYEFGGDALTTEEAKSAIEKMSFPLVGVDSFAVVVGAVDSARGRATDALLKGIEEHEPFVTPILWATSLNEVPKTIRSRCRVVWSYASSPEPKEEYLRLARNCVGGNHANVIIQLNELKAKPLEVLFELGNALSQLDFTKERVVTLWVEIRLALRQVHPISKNELLGVLCF
jgi:hypothetical protein